MKWTEVESGAASPGLAWLVCTCFIKCSQKTEQKASIEVVVTIHVKISFGCPPPEQCCHILPFVFNWAAVQNYIFLLPRSFHPQKMSQLLISLLGIFPINFFLDRVQYNVTFSLDILISMFCSAAISHRIWTWFCCFQRFRLRVYLRNQFTKTAFTLTLL